MQNINQTQSTVYLYDYPHYGVGSLIESMRYFLTKQIFPYRKSTISTYNKFIAALQLEGNLPQSNNIQANADVLAPEVLQRPALNIDPMIELDDDVSKQYFNYFNINNTFSYALNQKCFLTTPDNLLRLYTIKMWIKANLDCMAVFNSYYEKMDHDIRLLQYFRGLDRTSQPLQIETFIPLPELLINSFPNVDWTSLEVSSENCELRYSADRLIAHTGQILPHVIYMMNPLVTLTSIADSSEKYGGDKVPDFKTNFSISIEGYIPIALIGMNYYKLAGVVSGLSFPGMINGINNFIITFLEMLLQVLLQTNNISIEQLITFINALIQYYGFTNLTQLSDFLYKNIFESQLFIKGGNINKSQQSLNFLENFLKFLQEQGYLTNFTPYALYSLLTNIIQNMNLNTNNLLGNFYQSNQYANSPLKYYNNIPLTLTSIGNTCFTNLQNNYKIITYLVTQYYDVNQSLTIPSNVWNPNGNYMFVGILNVPTNYYLDGEGNIIINGPILNDINIAILVIDTTVSA